MKIYVVTKGLYETTWVAGSFSSLEAAKASCAGTEWSRHEDGRWLNGPRRPPADMPIEDHAEIVETELDRSRCGEESHECEVEG